MAEDLFTINSLTGGKIISVAPTLNKSNFNRSIYYLLYMTIPSGGPRIKADFAHEEKVLINKCLWLSIKIATDSPFQNHNAIPKAIDY